MSMQYEEQFKEETLSLHHRRVYFIILAGIGMILMFSLLDYIVVPQLYGEFLLYRLAVCLIGGILLLANSINKFKGKELSIGFIGYICAGAAIITMVIRMGGLPAPYYVGLIVAMTIYTSIAPLTASQTLFAGFTLIIGYFVSIYLFTDVSPDMWVEFFNTLFFLICFVLIAATQSWAESSARRQEFQLRMKENELNEELIRHATILEQEVEKRKKEQEVSEEKYRHLYNSIADFVVLVDKDGNILQYNTSFQRFFSVIKEKNNFLFNHIRAEDRAKMQHHLLEVIAVGGSVTGFQIALVSSAKESRDMEISGTLLKRGERSIGIQLVIRDITIRKQLEKRLVTSLQRVKQTESATILALAKLSEYRDFTPGNHLERIREYCRIIGSELSQYPDMETILTPNYLHDLYHASILHDIGKVSIPDSVVSKNKSLTEEEQNVVRKHTLVGGDVIASMEKESHGGGFLAMAKVIAYFHHEHWDGTGYPYGLKKTEIPLAARILAVADAYEEMTTTHQEGNNTHGKAAEQIIHGSGHQFDPMIVDAFSARLDEVDIIRRTFTEK